MITVTTLADHYEGYNLGAVCNVHTCGHSGPVDVLALARRYGWNTPLAALKARPRCSRCGSRDTHWQVAGLSDPDGSIHSLRRAVIDREKQEAERRKAGPP